MPQLAQNECALPSPPTDSISSIAFSPEGDQLAVSSWDSTVKIYTITASPSTKTCSAGLKASFDHPAVVFAVCWGQGKVFSACLDQRVRMLDVNDNSVKVLGSHENAVRCIAYSSELNVVISGSWDTTIKVWDPSTSTCTATVKTSGKIHSMHLQGPNLVISQDARKIAVVKVQDLKDGSDLAANQRESSLKYMTRAVRCMPNGQGFVSGSIEGRIAVDYYDAEQKSPAKYSFKCHRSTTPNIVYLVNALAFHPEYSTFASGGSDGHVALWDADAKRRLKHFGPYGQSVSALDFTQDGSLLAIALSYGFEKGEAGMPTTAEEAPSIVVRYVQDECLPKAKK